MVSLVRNSGLFSTGGSGLASLMVALEDTVQSLKAFLGLKRTHFQHGPHIAIRRVPHVLPGDA